MNPRDQVIHQDTAALERMGYTQELSRRMGAFSNFAISMSIICILSGGVTSFHLGYCATGGASIGLGWPLATLFSLAAAASLGQLASAFPTAGGLYHWAAILGGKGWGWATAWFNLAGLVTVLAAINVGTYAFLSGSLGPAIGLDPNQLSEPVRSLVQFLSVAMITLSQAWINHKGIRLTTRLTDFSGYWILGISGALTIALLIFAPSLDPWRLITFSNHSGLPTGRSVWPESTNLTWLFALGLLLPAYTITGFDASAHASEETLGATRAVPWGMVRSVLVSGIFGWIMLATVVMAIPDPQSAAEQGDAVFGWVLHEVLPRPLALGFVAAIGVAQYLCGLATVTSGSRMAFAFARDEGLPHPAASKAMRRVSPRHATPSVAIWWVAIAAIAFTFSTRVYSTIVSVCTIFLYLSYTLPTLAGLKSYGRTWTTMGPWSLGRFYRPIALVCVIGCIGLIAIGMAPPNDGAFGVVGGAALTLVVIWRVERKRFPGPPRVSLNEKQDANRL